MSFKSAQQFLTNLSENSGFRDEVCESLNRESFEELTSKSGFEFDLSNIVEAIIAKIESDQSFTCLFE